MKQTPCANVSSSHRVLALAVAFVGFVSGSGGLSAAAAHAAEAAQSPAVAAPEAVTVTAHSTGDSTASALLLPALGGEEDPTGRRVRVGAFADLGYAVTKNGSNRDFQIGQLVLHGTVDLPRGFGVFTEVSVNSTPSWETRVERILISYEYSDALKLTLGRHHLPVTWWNSTFHHGLWLQTTARRPLMIGYSDAFIPNHAVGLVAEGLLPVLPVLGIRYHLGVSGGGDDHKHTSDGSKEPGRLAATAGLWLEPPALPNLRIGSVAYFDPHRTRNGKHVAETLVGSHVIWSGERPELAGEFVLVHHQSDGVANAYWSQAAYVQAAWRLYGAAEAFKPYARWDRMRLNAIDPTLKTSTSQDLWTAGVRWDVIDSLALRLEGARREVVGATASWELLLQASAAW